MTKNVIDVAEREKRYAEIETWLHDALRAPDTQVVQFFDCKGMAGIEVRLAHRGARAGPDDLPWQRIISTVNLVPPSPPYDRDEVRRLEREIDPLGGL